MPSNYQADSGSRQSLRNLPRPQKVAVSFLALFAIFIIVFWVAQFRSRLRGPFMIQENAETDVAAIFDAKQMDTDSDGLSDYEESSLYNTSPYLEDSDSDGLSDKQEVDAGSDPNCPQGKSCGLEAPASTATTSLAEDINILPDTSSASSSEDDALSAILNGQIDAASLRQFLIDSGADKEMLDKVSDEELMQSYQQALIDQNSQ